MFVSGTAGQDNAYVQIQVTDSTPTKLFYQCGNHQKMGNYLLVKGYANIQDGGLSIAKTNGLQTALDGKQSTIENGDLSITHVSGLQASLNSKISSIDDGSLTIAKTSGLQTALDSKISIAGGTFTNTPLAPTASADTNNTTLATTEYVTRAMNNVVDGAPGALNTLNELAAALGDDSSFASTVTTSLAGKQDTLTAGNNITITNNTISATGKPLNVIGSADGVAAPVTTDVDSITFDKDAGFKVTASGKMLQ